MTQWNSKNYKSNSVPQELSAMDALDSYSFTGNEQVLDVGCGDGRISAAIAERVADGHVAGIDNSQDMIEYAQEQHGNIKNLTFKKADIQNFTTEKKFDVIVSFSTLHWVKDQDASLRNIYNALKPGGKILIRTAGDENQQIAKLFNDEYWKQQFTIKEDTFHAKSAHTYNTLLNDTGFKSSSITSMNAVSSFSNEDILSQWLMAWVPYATGLKNNKAHEFTQAIVTDINKNKKSDKEKPIDFVVPLLHIEAQK